ncbi:MAG: NAD(P)/FAD-dependent oxidoreductase [Burkholderiales bacterium]
MPPSELTPSVPESAVHCEVLVIGGGPAGSTIATLLAQRGRDVVLLEKSRHPRFHIGESLLPLNLPLFEKLGVKEEIESLAMIKWGVQFNSPNHERSVTLNFSQAWDKSFPYAYQVRRSVFDEVLFRNAQSKGARAQEDVKVTHVEFHDQGVRVRAKTADGVEQHWSTRFVVDASGRDTFFANQFRIKEKNKRHNSAAVFGHFTGAQRLEGRDEGNISIFWFDHGWFWLIPLSDGTTSVGAVCWPYYLKTRKTPVDQFFLDTIALCPALAKRLEHAHLVEPATATGNYSYTATRASGPHHIMLGDAYAFIDPVFSSGVFLAMHSAFVGADTVETCLDRPREAQAALKHFDRISRRGPKVFSWFIYRVTTPAMRELFMNPSNDGRLVEVLLAVLAGDIFRGTPIGGRLLVFKAVYYLTGLHYVRRTLAAWRRRRRIARETLDEAVVG